MRGWVEELIPLKMIVVLSHKSNRMTGPVRSAYFMLSSTELQSDFDSLTGQGFLSQWNYPKICGVIKSSLMDLELFAMAA